MIKSDSRSLLRPKKPGEELDRGVGGLRARLDAPHPVGELLSKSGAEPAAASEIAERYPVESPPVADEPASEQLQRQALQLAGHLRDRQRELDVREAELNSRLAQWETEARAVRLSFAEREAELVDGTETLAEERRDFLSQSQSLVAREAEIASRLTQVAERENKASDREKSLAERESEVRRRLARLAAVEAEQQRVKPRAGPRRTDEPAATLREQVAQEYRQAMAGLEQQREQLRRRAEHLHQCRLALRVTHDDLARLHQDTLEMRLAMEELWAQLSGAAPPAALIQSLGEIRAKLADQSQAAQAALSEEQKEIERLRGELAAQYEKLAEQKAQFETWAAARTEQCRAETSRLLAREEELNRREAFCRERSQRWAAERLRYQHELRRLESELHTCQEAVAAGAVMQDAD